MGTMTFFKDSNEWWISKTYPNGEEEYPKRILVGKSGEEVEYLPQRQTEWTTATWDYDDGYIASCNSCGEVLSEDEEYLPSYCPGCGRRVRGIS